MEELYQLEQAEKMADIKAADIAAKEAVRRQERSVWTKVEDLGAQLRATDSVKQSQTVTQADRDAVAKKPTEGMGI